MVSFAWSIRPHGQEKRIMSGPAYRSKKGSSPPLDRRMGERQGKKSRGIGAQRSKQQRGTNVPRCADSLSGRRSLRLGKLGQPLAPQRLPQLEQAAGLDLPDA